MPCGMNEAYHILHRIDESRYIVGEGVYCLRRFLKKVYESMHASRHNRNESRHIHACAVCVVFDIAHEYA